MNAEPEDGASSEHEAGAPPKKQRASADSSDKVRAKWSKDGAKHKLQRITVEGEGVMAPAAEAPRAASDALPLVIPAPSADGELVLPSRAELELILAKAETCEDIAGFERMAAACADLARHCDHLKGRLAEFTMLRLRSRRRLGLVLLQTDRRGGVRAKWLGATLLEKDLPVDPTTAKKCRKLARIPDAAIEEYFRVMVEQGAVPSEAGVIRFAANAERAGGSVQAKPRKAKRPRVESAARVLSDALLDAVQMFMRDIDVCIGDAKVKCGKQLSADTADSELIRGKVFISECRDPGECLSRLANLRIAGAVAEALVVLPHDTGATWFKAVAQSEWHCCFPTGGGALVAYLGSMTRGFVVTFGQVGAVMFGCAGTESAS